MGDCAGDTMAKCMRTSLCLVKQRYVCAASMCFSLTFPPVEIVSQCCVRIFEHDNAIQPSVLYGGVFTSCLS